MSLHSVDKADCCITQQLLYISFYISLLTPSFLTSRLELRMKSNNPACFTYHLLLFQLSRLALKMKKQ